MSDVKHTPGPWSVSNRVEDGWALIDGGNWFEFAKVVIRMEDEDDTNPTGVANARLIASAPDLLDALKGLVGFFEGDDKADWTAARAAIAKAEGRS